MGFFRRFKFVLLMVLLFSAVFFLPAPVVQPLRQRFSKAARPVFTIVSGAAYRLNRVIEIPRMMKEHRVLKLQHDQFEDLRFRIRELESENRRLGELLKFKDRLDRRTNRTLVARVIGRNPAAWRDAIILDQGKDQGMVPGVPVLNHSGLLGQVIEVSDSSSLVRLVTSPRFRAGALIQKTRHSGVVFGTVNNTCRMKYIAMDAEVEPGDAILTAGLSDQFPKGILIGWIADTWKEPGQMYRVANIRLASDVDRLEEVVCVLP